MIDKCPGAKSRINPRRPHMLCRQCDRFEYDTRNGITPRLVDDGVATCPDRIPHAYTVGAIPPECAPLFPSVGRNTGGAE